MRVVVDTNVLISAALKADSAPRYSVRWVQRQGIFLKSYETEDELRRTLAKPRLAPLFHDLQFVAQLTTLLAEAESVSIVNEIRACRDPDDDKFLELAVDGKADVIVSGDAALLELNPFRDILFRRRRSCAAHLASSPASGRAPAP
jgi:putative PIN family toxin of toxin-antitoxin system